MFNLSKYKIKQIIYMLIICLIISPNFQNMVLYADDSEALTVSNFSITRNEFASYKEGIAFNYFCNKSAKAILKIRDKKNERTYIEINGEAIRSEKNILYWDGKFKDGEFIPEEEYVFDLTVIDEDLNTSNEFKKIKVIFVAPMGNKTQSYVTQIEGLDFKPADEAVRKISYDGKSGLAYSFWGAVLGLAIGSLTGEKTKVKAKADSADGKDTEALTKKGYDQMIILTEAGAGIGLLFGFGKKTVLKSNSEYNNKIQEKIDRKNVEIDKNNQLMKESFKIKLQIIEDKK